MIFPRVFSPLCVIALCLGSQLPLPLEASPHPTAVSDDGAHLSTSEGKAFLWIGDTAWELFHKLDREEAIHYLDKRAKQGFTVIQAVILAELDGLRTPNAYGDLPLIDLDPARPNEAYFEHVDFIVNAAAERGIAMGLLPTWGDKIKSLNPGAGPLVFTTDNAQSFGSYLGERYRDAPVVWILGGDRNVDFPESRAIWEALAEGLENGMGNKQLITYHPRGTAHSAWFFHNADWLDFNMYQSGHGEHAVPVYDYAKTAMQFLPRQPFVDGESAYEDIAVRFWDYLDFSKPSRERVPDGVLNPDGSIRNKAHFAMGFINDHDVRRQAYWNFLSGAAGYTYGHNSIWQMFERGGDFAIPALFSWREALNRPGANDMRHLRSLFATRPFSKLLPDQSLIVGINRHGPDHIRAAISEDHSFAIIYLPTPQTISTPITKVHLSAVAWWFNPREGSARPAEFEIENGHATFTSPTNGERDDWILVIDSPDSKYAKEIQ